jgi:DNA end-binding protein Ku
VAVRPMGDVLGMATMLFADEVLSPGRLDEVADAAEVKTTKRELDVAKQLVDSLAADFKPDAFRDTYREQVLELIERKAQGKAIAVQPTPEEVAAPAPDLMSALRASLDAVRAREGHGATADGGRAKPGKAAKKPAAKKAALAKATTKKPTGKQTVTKKPAAKR